MPGDGQDAIGLDQKPEGTGSLIGALQPHSIESAWRTWMVHPAGLGLEKTMPTALTARVLAGWSLAGSNSVTSASPVTREQRPGMSPNPQMFGQDCSEEEMRAICEGLAFGQNFRAMVSLNKGLSSRLVLLGCLRKQVEEIAAKRQRPGERLET
jgi:hypothetical protein